MKRLAVCLTFIAALAMIHPTAAQAAYCGCGPSVKTPTLTAGGPLCSLAKANLEDALWNYISCALCREPVLTSTCNFSGGEDPYASVTGYFTYRCYQVGGGCQIP